eukprot:m.372513 g.372513  ORF g.372513 m.372513 type:complete len:405 (-) comp20874_c0_seq16:144-1358(-)
MRCNMANCMAKRAVVILVVVQLLAPHTYAIVGGVKRKVSSGFSYPRFMQCDSRWGSDEMGVNGPGERATICREGCAMSCVAMALAGQGFTLPTQSIMTMASRNRSLQHDTSATPKTLNSWLEHNRGYTCADNDCNNLVLNITDKLTNGRMRFVGEWNISDLSANHMATDITSGDMVYLGHVHNPEVPGHPVDHFVLLTAYDIAEDTFNVNDPYFNKTTYKRSEVADVLMYEMLPATAVVPVAFPLYKQCDPAWGDNSIHVKTVCAVGCLMSSTAMALAQRGITVQGSVSTPGTLNGWLKTHNGYVAGTDDLQEGAVSRIDPGRVSWSASGMHTTNDIAFSTIIAMLHRGGPVIANVMNGGHFVLVVGYAPGDNDTLYVNDPGFNRASYSYADDVVGWRLYNMTA